MVSLAVMWRLPVLCARDPEDSFRILRFLATNSAPRIMGFCNERRGDVASLALGQRCGGTLREYVVSFDGGQWRLGPPGTGKDRGWVSGIGSGFVGGRPPECACP